MADILGKKIGMTQVFDEKGDAVSVTVVQAGPCVVVQRKTKAKDGYDAIQVGFDELPESKAKKKSKPLLSHYQKKGVKPQRFLQEFRVSADAAFEVGQRLTVEIFKAGEIVNVSGVSKGKGFAGVIKRHGKAGGPATHGSRFHRSTGSIGQRTSPGEVFKNMKLPGHLGSEKVTVKKLRVVEVRPQDHLIFIRGAVPGGVNNLLSIRSEKTA